MACPDESVLLEYLGGLASKDVSLHVAACSTCSWIARQVEGGDASHDDALVDAMWNQDPMLGRYRVLRLLAHGGMGAVFVAYDPDLDRNVALKVLRPDRVSGSARQALLAEARAAAQLNHPNVLTIHDVGIAADQVYIAMELAGTRLDAWLVQRRRSWQEILRMFLRIIDGVAAAHAKGIVHRDIKPGNILVSDTGDVKVSDFGLAQRDGNATQPTTGGTPAYMAPEQRLGQGANPASDQYSLCVTLYEALYGRRPETATRGSLRPANATGDSRRPVGTRIPRHLHRTVLRGLAIDPADRYAGVRELGVALRKCLHRRRKAVGLTIVSGTAAVGLLLFAGIGSSTAGPACPAPDKKITRVWSESLRGRLVATKPDPFRSSIVARLDGFVSEWSRHYVSICRDTRVSHQFSEPMLDARMACMGRELERFRSLAELLANDPESIAKATPAVDALDPHRCDDLSALKASMSARTPRQKALLTEFYRTEDQAMNLLELLRFDEVELPLRELESIARNIDAPQTSARAHLVRAQLNIARDRFEDAEVSLNEAVFAAQQAGDDSVMLRAAMLLANYDAKTEPKIAKWWARLARGIALRLDEPSTLAQLAEAEAVVAYRAGDFDVAAERFAECLRLRRQLRGDKHPTVATAHQNLAVAHSALGQEKKAIFNYEQVIRIRTAVFGPAHGSLAGPVGGLGNLHMQHGRYRQAQVQLTQALNIVRSTYGDGHSRVSQAQVNLANAERRLGNHEHARALYEAARAASGSTPSRVSVIALRGLSEINLALGKHEEARRLAEQAVTAAESVYGPSHPSTGSIQLAAGEVLSKLGDQTAALRRFKRAQAIWESLPATAPRVGMALSAAGISRRLAGDLPGAVRSLERAVEIQGQGEADMANAEFELAIALRESGGDRERSLTLARRARGRLKSLPDLAPQLAEIDDWLEDDTSKNKPESRP